MKLIIDTYETHCNKVDILLGILSYIVQSK